jgi:regulator of sirC expression with transglutaminase-like and TPR domain
MGSLFRKYWILPAVLLFIFIAYFSPLNPNSFETKLNSIVPEDKNNFDFTKTVLSLSALVDPGMDIAWTKNELNTMAAALKGEIGEEGNAEKIIKSFNRYFFEQEHFTFDNTFNLAGGQDKTLSFQDLVNFNSIEQTLKRKQGICMTMTLVYLMLGEKLRLPMYGVMIPGHIYVRYREPGRSGINIETTYSGEEYYGYKSLSGVEFLDEKKMGYGKELDKYSIVGMYLNNLGNFYITTGRRGRAEIILKRSIEMVPDIAEAYINLGLLYEGEHRQEKALDCYSRSLEIYPKNTYVMTRIGKVYLDAKRFIKAQEILEDVLKSDTSNAEAKQALKLAVSKGGS